VNRRRAEILAEMGLAPVWRLRRRLPPPGEPAAAAKLQGGPVAAAVDLPASGESRERGILAFDWPALKQRVAGCTDCRLRASCRQTVFGVGDERASWMLVGEAPGADEDRMGEPFVGQAGRLLDNMLAALGLARGTDVYIANVLKCRPPGNRNPQPDEVAQCSPYLLRQIGLIQPKLIVAMGRFAAQTLLNTDASIASLRGRVHRYAGVPLVVTYHPAYLLRNLPDKAKAWSDLRFAARTITAAG
jgi:uracil-DNA glycosylase family 4